MIHLHFWPAEGPAGLHSIVAKFNNRVALDRLSSRRGAGLNIADSLDDDPHTPQHEAQDMEPILRMFSCSGKLIGV
jgi:hypothetical protein